MNDGNEESAKELLATFRVVFTTSLSVLLLATNFHFNGLLVVVTPWLFIASLGLLATSCVGCLGFFLIAVPLLYHERDDIAYQPALMGAGVLSAVFFILGVAAIVL